MESELREAERLSFIEVLQEVLEHANELVAGEVELAIRESHDARTRLWIDLGYELSRTRKAVARVLELNRAGGAQ
jgi:uncharacterized protein YaeQ